MAGPIIVLDTPEGKRQARFARNLMRSQLLQQGLQQVANALQSVGDYRKKEDLEKFGKLSTAAELMGGYNKLPADARTWLAKYAIGTTEGLPMAPDGGPQFDVDVEKEWKNIEYQRRMTLSKLADAGDLDAIERIRMLEGTMSPEKPRSEIEADAAKNRFDFLKWKLDYDLKVSDEAGRNKRAQLRAGGIVEDTYPVRTAEGIWTFVNREQFAMKFPDKEPKPITYKDMKELQTYNKEHADTMKMHADLAAQALADPGEQALLGMIEKYQKIQKNDEDNPVWGMLLDPLLEQYAEHNAEKGRSLESVMVHINEMGGWTGPSEVQQRYMAAVVRGYSKYQAGQGKLAKDVLSSNTVADSIMKIFSSPTASSMDPAELVAQVKDVVRTQFPDIKEEKIIDAIASDLMRRVQEEAATGVPRPE